MIAWFLNPAVGPHALEFPPDTPRFNFAVHREGDSSFVFDEAVSAPLRGTEVRG